MELQSGAKVAANAGARSMNTSYTGSERVKIFGQKRPVAEVLK